LWQHENAARQAGFARVAGVDEVGRGPLAGPVLAACVILPTGFDLTGINDSKKLSERQRERAEARIRAEAVAVGIGSVEPEVIDRINILQATHEAMRLAYAQIAPPPDFVLLDGLPVRGFPCAETQALVQGDSRSVSIAAASVVAKVARDRLMCAYDTVYPEYGFAGHKGYGSARHLAALAEHGPCPIHRRSFAPVAACCRPKGLSRFPGTLQNSQGVRGLRSQIFPPRFNTDAPRIAAPFKNSEITHQKLMVFGSGCASPHACDMDVKQPTRGIARLIVALAVVRDMVKVAQNTHSGMVSFRHQCRSLVHAADEVAFRAVQRLDCHRHAVPLRRFPGAAQKC